METALIEAGTICVQTSEALVLTIGGGLITAAAAISNFVGKDTTVGKIVNWIGLNFSVEKKAS